MNSSSSFQRVFTSALFGVPLLLLLLVLPASAHHPLGMAEGTPLTPLMGLLSGLAHPILGLDHALFLLSIACVGVSNVRRWVIPLLAVGLAGSACSQWMHLLHLPAALEVVAALSLVTSGLVSLNLLPPLLLLPMMFVHGLGLGSQIVGSESTPILLYLIGLFITQSVFLLASCWLARMIQVNLSSRSNNLIALAWIGVGLALAWSAIGAN